MRATNENPIYDSEKLDALTSWDSPWQGLAVVVAGLGVSGFSAADTLIELGARVVVVDGTDSEENRAKADTLMIVGATEVLLGEDAMAALPPVEGREPELVITSPGLSPRLGILAEAAQRRIQIWGDVELAWRLNSRRGRKTPRWLCVTGTNGKTTTVGMTTSILRAAGLQVAAVGNVGTPILDALRDPVEYDYFVVELSSFQLHWTHSMSPLAAVVLNVAEDHIDWHGSYQNYLADKARIFENTQVACIFNAHQPETVTMVEEAEVVEGARAIGFWANTPGLSMVGVVENLLVDRAFTDKRRTEALELADISEISALPTQHTVENAAAAAALARAAGVEPHNVRLGLRDFQPAPHRIQPVATTEGVLWINDSKATNPHAAQASLASFTPVIWLAGGLSKGVDYRPLVSQHRDRLKAVILIGTDTAALAEALADLAPDVPVTNITDRLEDPTDGAAAMKQAVAEAHRQAVAEDTVLMAPAAASMDQFVSYADRGNTFIAAVEELITTLNAE